MIKTFFSRLAKAVAPMGITLSTASRWPNLSKGAEGGIVHYVSADNGANYAELWGREGGSYYAVTGAGIFQMPGLAKGAKLNEALDLFLKEVVGKAEDGEELPDTAALVKALSMLKKSVRALDKHETEENPEHSHDPHKGKGKTEERHPGKFESSGAIGEKLHQMSLEGGPDEECGSHETGGSWYGLMTDTGIKGAPHAILTEDNQGFVDFEAFKTAEEARAAFAEIQEEEEGPSTDSWAEDSDEDPWPKSEEDRMVKGKTARREPKRREAMWKGEPVAPRPQSTVAPVPGPRPGSRPSPTPTRSEPAMKAVTMSPAFAKAQATLRAATDALEKHYTSAGPHGHGAGTGTFPGHVSAPGQPPKRGTSRSVPPVKKEDTPHGGPRGGQGRLHGHMGPGGETHEHDYGTHGKVKTSPPQPLAPESRTPGHYGSGYSEHERKFGHSASHARGGMANAEKAARGGGTWATKPSAPRASTPGEQGEVAARADARNAGTAPHTHRTGRATPAKQGKLPGRPYSHAHPVSEGVADHPVYQPKSHGIKKHGGGMRGIPAHDENQPHEGHKIAPNAPPFPKRSGKPRLTEWERTEETRRAGYSPAGQNKAVPMSPAFAKAQQELRAATDALEKRGPQTQESIGRAISWAPPVTPRAGPRPGTTRSPSASPSPRGTPKKSPSYKPHPSRRPALEKGAPPGSLKSPSPRGRPLRGPGAPGQPKPATTDDKLKSQRVARGTRIPRQFSHVRNAEVEKRRPARESGVEEVWQSQPTGDKLRGLPARQSGTTRNPSSGSWRRYTPRLPQAGRVAKHQTEENPEHSHNPQGGHFKPEVRTEKFEGSHGRKPKGTGGWAFQYDNDPKPHFIQGSVSYAEAKRQAMAEGRRRGASRVHVLP